MINTSKIRGRIYEKGYNYGELADLMGVRPYTFGQKIAGKRMMTLDEAYKLKELLEIPDSEVAVYFMKAGITPKKTDCRYNTIAKRAEPKYTGHKGVR